MKFDHAFEMFNTMMQFALNNGMTSYQSDLMHDAVSLSKAEEIGDPIEFLWVVKSNGCGTWLWNTSGEIPSIVTSDTGAKVVIKFDGGCWTFYKQ